MVCSSMIYFMLKTSKQCLTSAQYLLFRVTCMFYKKKRVSQYFRKWEHFTHEERSNEEESILVERLQCQLARNEEARIFCQWKQ